MIKYSIVCCYLDRCDQFIQFMKSLDYWYPDRYDYEIILVVDSKTRIDDYERLKWLVKGDTRIKEHFYNNSNSLNPCRLFNFGVSKASGEYIIITNPETVFLGDILGGLDRGFDQHPDSYQVCACLDGEMYKNPLVYTARGWYQHSVHNNRMFHFCSSLKKSLYEEFGGFDEHYALGCGYDDNDLVETIKAAKIPFVVRDDILVLHQYHERNYQLSVEMAEGNKQYFLNKWGLK